MQVSWLLLDTFKVRYCHHILELELVDCKLVEEQELALGYELELVLVVVVVVI